MTSDNYETLALDIVEIHCEQIKSNSKQIISELSSEFIKLLNKVMVLNKSAAYIEISSLRRTILEDNMIILIEVFDENWLFDGLLIKYSCIIPTLNHIIDQFKKAVNIEAKSYMGRFPNYLAEKAILLNYKYLEEALFKVLQSSVNEWLLIDRHKRIFNQKYFRCSLGEYRRFQHVIYERANK